jgi:hypothetical protein
MSSPRRYVRSRLVRAPQRDADCRPKTATYSVPLRPRRPSTQLLEGTTRHACLASGDYRRLVSRHLRLHWSQSLPPFVRRVLHGGRGMRRDGSLCQAGRRLCQTNWLHGSRLAVWGLASRSRSGSRGCFSRPTAGRRIAVWAGRRRTLWSGVWIWRPNSPLPRASHGWRRRRGRGLSLLHNSRPAGLLDRQSIEHRSLVRHSSTPAMVAVMSVASVPPSMARKPKRARSLCRSGASPPRPPI